MTTRERTLSTLVGGFLALFVVGAGGYLLVYHPVADMTAEATKLENDIAEMDLQLTRAAKDKKRLDVALKRSLPDHPFAAQEYEAALAKLLRDAKLPAGSYDVKFRPADGRPVPELAPKKPAYSRVVLEITMRKATYAHLLDVLNRYYGLNLLQQITRFNVKRADDPSARPTASTSADRPDLTVTFTTEAIVLDGAEKRGILLPHPVGAAVSGVAYAIPGPARGLTPIELAPVLATADREYGLLTLKDIFHGPPPPAPKAPPPAPPPPVVTKEDTSPFIRLTALGRSADGSGMAVIEDLAAPGKMEYTVSLRRTSDGLAANVTKEYFLKGKRKKYDADAPVLDISEASSGTDRKFRVVGVDGDNLILAERKAAAEPAALPQGGGVRGKGPSRGPAAAPAAVVGAVAAGVPSEKVFAWRQGEPLNRLKELSGTDAALAVQRATGLATVPAAAPAVPLAAPVLGSAATAAK